MQFQVPSAFHSDAGYGVRLQCTGRAHLCSERLSHLLATSKAHLLTYAEIIEAAGIAKQHLSKYLANPSVRSVMRTRGWRKVTRKAAGLSGRGYVLIRK